MCEYARMFLHEARPIVCADPLLDREIVKLAIALDDNSTLHTVMRAFQTFAIGIDDGKDSARRLQLLKVTLGPSKKED